MWQRDSRDRTVLQATPAAAIDVSELLFSLVFFFTCFKFLCVFPFIDMIDFEDFFFSDSAIEECWK